MVEYIHGVVECSHKNDYIRRKLTLEKQTYMLSNLAKTFHMYKKLLCVH